MKDAALSWLGAEALAFREHVLDGAAGLSARALSDRAKWLDYTQTTHLAQHCLNLYPGTNMLSPVGPRCSARRSPRARQRGLWARGTRPAWPGSKKRKCWQAS